jgi:hypothetical protein
VDYLPGLLAADKKKRETKMNVHKKGSLVAPEPDDKTAEVAAFATYLFVNTRSSSALRSVFASDQSSSHKVLRIYVNS